VSTRRSRRFARTAVVITCALFVLVVAACASDDDAAAGNDNRAATAKTANEIVIKDFRFTVPASVEAGSTLTVRNEDTTPHTVEADDGGFDSGTIAAGKTATITVAEAGTFPFHCGIHNYMTGTLTVT
jgi:plastocyanin